MQDGVTGGALAIIVTAVFVPLVGLVVLAFQVLKNQNERQQKQIDVQVLEHRKCLTDNAELRQMVQELKSYNRVRARRTRLDGPPENPAC